MYGSLFTYVMILAAAILFAGKILSSKYYIRSAEDLVGKEGIAYTDIDIKFGVAQVRDENKMSHKIFCQSCRDTIVNGTKIIVSEYNIDNKVYKAIPLSELTKKLIN